MKVDFTKYILNLNDLIQKPEFPDCLHIGMLDNKIPFLIPTKDLNGLCLNHFGNLTTKFNEVFENITLQLLNQLNQNLLKITIIDFGLATSFKSLMQLKSNSHIFKLFEDQKEFSKYIDELLNYSRRLNNLLFETNSTSIFEYNKSAEVKEKYNIILISNYPNGISIEDVKKLDPIIQNAYKLGFLFFINFNESFLQHNSFIQNNNEFFFNIQSYLTTIKFNNEKIEYQNLYPQLIKHIGNKTLKLIEYAKTEKSENIIKLNRSFSEAETSIYKDFFKISIGYSNGKKEYLTIGEQSGNNHILVAGGSRMGKSTFLNNIITKIAEEYSSDNIRLYLVDFKNGDEFKKFKKHPNVEYLLLENEKFDNTLLVLNDFKNEVKIRSKKFKSLNDDTISNIDLYNEKVVDKIHRTILIIDEAHILFKSGYKEKNEVNKIINAIMRQGGSYGLYIILCSQSFQGVDIDNDAKSQSNVRISFKMSNNTDCSFIGVSEKATNLEKAQILLKDMKGERLVNLDNIDVKSIEGRLKSAKEKFTNCKSFDLKIIEENTEV